MNAKIITASLAGFMDAKENREEFSYRYSLSSVYNFIQLTRLPTDIAFEIYEFINPTNFINLEQLKKIIFQIEFLTQTKQLKNTFPLDIYEDKFADPVFTDRFFHLVKSMVKNQEVKINYINFKFIDDRKVYCLNMKFKVNKKLIRCFSLKFIVKESYRWNAGKCRYHKTHNHRLCKFLH